MYVSGICAIFKIFTIVTSMMNLFCGDIRMKTGNNKNFCSDLRGKRVIKTILCGIVLLAVNNVSNAATPPGTYFINVSALSPSTAAPVILQNCQTVTTPSAPQCGVLAGGIKISQGSQSCEVGGAESCAINPQGSTLIITGWGSGGGGGGGSCTSGRCVTIINNTSVDPVIAYMGFNANTFGSNIPSSFTGCSFTTGNKYICQFTVSKAVPVTFNFDTSTVSPAFSLNAALWSTCPLTMAEFTFNGNGGQDTIDVSLVNGISNKANVTVTPSSGGNPQSIVGMKGSVAPYNTIPGVYPPRCDQCTSSSSPPQPPYFPTCPSGTVPSSQCQASPNCQLTRTPSVSDTYTVTFSDPS